MISLSLITFFGSLILMIGMIGRKYMVIDRNSYDYMISGTNFEIPYLDEMRETLILSLKKLENLTLTLLLRYHLKITTFLKTKHREIRRNLRSAMKRNKEAADEREVSKFLQMISHYKDRVDEIKERIKEEEKS